jgi:hypothetical protein
MSKRKFYKTTITLVVLSEEPIPDEMNIPSIAFEATDGSFSMADGARIQVELNGKEAAVALSEQGSDPGFFRLNDDGVDQE